MTRVASRHRTYERPVGWDRVQPLCEKTSQDDKHSSWVIEFSLEIHASVSLHMHRECNVTWLLFLNFELTQAHIVRLFFVLSSHSLDCIFVAMKKCAIPLSEPLDDHRPRSEMVWRSWCIRGAEGVLSHDTVDFKHKSLNVSLSGTFFSFSVHLKVMAKSQYETYWPSIELSIKRYTCVNNRCGPWRGWIRCWFDAHKKQVYVKHL